MDVFHSIQELIRVASFLPESNIRAQVNRKSSESGLLFRVFVKMASRRETSPGTSLESAVKQVQIEGLVRANCPNI